jgi:acetyltransferase-like isoleucine patch superfamily enzyme
MESVIRRLYSGYLNTVRRSRGFRLAVFIRICGGTVGKGLRCDKGVHLRHAPSPLWSLGESVSFGRGVVLDIWPGASLSLGSEIRVMHNVVIGAHSAIEIGSHSQIAECSSIRDADHGTESGQMMASAAMRSERVSIGHDVWIARGVAILAGAKVGNGAVIGANSVVRGIVPDQAIAVGAPARVVRLRSDAPSSSPR